ncbi:MAG: nitroreductase [Methanospirillum sp.]
MIHTISPFDVRGGRSRRLATLVIAAALLAAFIVTAASAADVGGETIPGTKHVYIHVANNDGARFDLFKNDTYYIKFDGGGINALHITTNPLDTFGQVTKTAAGNGTFYIADSGGRGFFDDLVLLVAVREPVPDDFAVRLRSSGYTWPPTTELNHPPELSALTYHDPGLDETFTRSDFRYTPQSWKPSGTDNYPVMEGVDPASGTAFRFLFIDLNVGALGLNSDQSGLKYNGTARVEYSLANTSSPVSFNVYGWNNQSNQGQGISWTNRVSGTGSSGYIVMEGPDTGTAAGSSEFGGATTATPVRTAAPVPTPTPATGVIDQLVAAINGLLKSLGLTGGGHVAGEV